MKDFNPGYNRKFFQISNFHYIQPERGNIIDRKDFLLEQKTLCIYRLFQFGGINSVFGETKKCVERQQEDWNYFFHR